MRRGGTSPLSTPSMGDPIRITRRQFLKSTAAAAGIVTFTHHVPAISRAATETPSGAPAGVTQVPGDLVMTRRIDGVPKVTGEKIYVRDFRARDMPGWTTETRHALLAPGFLMAAFVLLDQLRRAPVARDGVDAAIMRAVGNNVCRCTGYVRYVSAIRHVVLQQPGLVTRA